MAIGTVQVVDGGRLPCLQDAETSQQLLKAGR